MAGERGRVQTLDKILAFLLIHYLPVVIPCPWICEMCSSDPPSTLLGKVSDAN